MKMLGGEGGLWERLRDEDEDERLWWGVVRTVERCEKGWDMRDEDGGLCWDEDCETWVAARV